MTCHPKIYLLQTEIVCPALFYIRSKTMIKTGLSLNNVIDIIVENIINSEKKGLKNTLVKNEHLKFLIKIINKLGVTNDRLNKND